MASNASTAEETPIEISSQMNATRMDLSEKVVLLEEKVTGYARDAGAVVSETIQDAKDVVHVSAAALSSTVASASKTAQDALASVRYALDLRHQVRQHPFLAVGASVLVGFAVGAWTARPRR